MEIHESFWERGGLTFTETISAERHPRGKVEGD